MAGEIEWMPTSAFDPSPGGAFVATYADCSGAVVLIAADGEILNGEDLEPVSDLTEYGLYAWLPDDFVTWGQSHA